MKEEIKNPRYPPQDWKKVQHVHEPLDTKVKDINIHYWEHRQTGDRHGFKFKNDTENY